jgi:hypothetical protein
MLCAPVLSPGLASADATADFTQGDPELESIGSIAFGPDGVLFVGDSRAGQIVALATDGEPGSGALDLEGIDQKIAGLLGTTPEDVRIHDLAVHPETHTAYLSVSRGQGDDETPLLLRVHPGGAIDELSLTEARFSKVILPGLPDPAAQHRGRSLRELAITDIAYLAGKVYVAGLSNEEFASKLRVVPFPFGGVDSGTSVEIYHGSHGAWETRSPIRTFVPYEVASDMHILAAYTCTPLVTFPVDAISTGAKIQGTTVAELGNRNRPLDMVVYQKNGRDFLLMANSSRGVMKIDPNGIEKAEAIDAPVDDKAGLGYERIAHLDGVHQLDRLDDEHALVLMEQNGSIDLKTIPLP